MRILFLIVCILTAASLRAEDREVKTISHGQSVELSKYLDPTHNTIVEFYADW